MIEHGAMHLCGQAANQHQWVFLTHHVLIRSALTEELSAPVPASSNSDAYLAQDLPEDKDNRLNGIRDKCREITTDAQ